MCEARATFAYYFWRGNPLNTLPPPNPHWAMLVGAPQVMPHHGQDALQARRCSARRGAGPGGGSQLIPSTASLQVRGKSAVPLAIAFAIYLLTPLASGSLLSGGRAEGEGEEGWGGTGTLLHRRWTVFLSSLPKGKEKASGGYSQGGSNSLFFHPAGERFLPSALCSPAPQASGVTRCLLRPQHHTAPTRWVGLKVLRAPLGL